MTLPQIQYITRDDKTWSHAQQARLMFENGIKWVQLRMKGHSIDEVEEQARECLRYAGEFGGTLIINDNIEIALSVKADGVHLGLKDTPIDEARKVLGGDFIIGGTANTFEQVMHQIDKGADYVGVGPYRFTRTKENLSPVLGQEGYIRIIERLRKDGRCKPLVAIGGIRTDEVPDLLNTGVAGVAISEDLFIKVKESKEWRN